MQSLLIRNARMVNEGQVREGDLLVRHGRIERIAGCLENCGASREIDAAGRYLLPGMIDDQVHFREPGYPQKGSIASESRAAVAGGITSFMDMPNTRPATLSLEALAERSASPPPIAWPTTVSTSASAATTSTPWPPSIHAMSPR